MTYSKDLYKSLQYAVQEAANKGHRMIFPAHLLLGLFRLEKGMAYEIIRQTGVDIETLRNSVSFQLFCDLNEEESIMQGKEQPEYNYESQRIIRLIDLETMASQQQVSDTQHLLLAIMRENNNAAATMLKDKCGLTYDKVKAEVLQFMPQGNTSSPKMEGFLDAEDDEDEGQPQNDKQTQTANKTEKKGSTSALDKFAINLTQRAKEGKLDPVVGRDNETTRVIQILSRRKKNNPVLIGEPGVGKSAIVEGLALRIVNREVSPMLFDKRIYTLDLASMVAGTKYRGQFEERMKAVLNDLQNNSDVILFIDEIHTIIGAGNASGSLDAANILKPALARGDIQCIGATTLNEYRQSIEKDGALERRFQKVIVAPTTKEETEQILQRLKPHYSEHHKVVFTDEAIHACVELTDRYITDRAFPDKAIDALDEAGANKRMQQPAESNSIKEIQDEIEDIKRQKLQVLNEQDFEKAVVLRDKENDLTLALKGEVERWKKRSTENLPQVSAEDVAAVVSMMSGVPVERVHEAESERLRTLTPRLEERVIGQDDAVRKVVRAIQRSRMGLKPASHPIGTFLFLGPTGVGKTYLAQCLAEEMFGKRDALIRIDMSEYMEKHAVSLLVGAPPGYVAHEDGGKLTEAVRRKPYSIVLFDEIEKAHPDVFNILLQVMDEGRLTDRQGRVVDFRNTIIILTSNSGTRQLKEFGAGIGFQSADKIDKTQAESILRKSLNKTFAPEFLNRVDNIIYFEQLSTEALDKIIEIELKTTRTQLAERGLELRLTDNAMALLRKQGYDVQYGARPIKRAIQTYVLDAVTELLLEGENKSNMIILDADGDKSWATYEL